VRAFSAIQRGQLIARWGGSGLGSSLDLVVALARKPKRTLRIGQDRIDARLQNCKLARAALDASDRH
jgi:hypothetical protein